MLKKISELTEQDKIRFLESTKKALEKEYGIPWSVIEQKIQQDLDDAFDDERFSKMNPDFAIDAAYARKYFGKKKPSLVDYVIWSTQFVAHSEYVEIN